jgi:hypothetical protein
MASVVTRCAVVAVALVAGAWLVLSFRAVELEADGRAILERAQRGTIPPDAVRRGQSFFQRAGRFNADQSPLFYESVLLFQTGRYEDAAAAAEQLVADEPDNVDGWIILHGAASGPAGAAREGDPKRAAEALRRVSALNPLAANWLR